MAVGWITGGMTNEPRADGECFLRFAGWRTAPILLREHEDDRLFRGVEIAEAGAVVLPGLVSGRRGLLFRPRAGGLAHGAGDVGLDRIRAAVRDPRAGVAARPLDGLPALPLPLLRVELFDADQGKGLFSDLPDRAVAASCGDRGVRRAGGVPARLPCGRAAQCG